ncbi:hypothetical protein BO71DRAFT_398415 [Aspergillus ellipticus CBS 707.79]|uniref:Uncharacterized protein n=1 Tax=Aspergillus ellipticus CBS 707.79 TaxID=1448320 RepID=A0A319DCZ0_9EURO|nr:hypothetical protein BO71DRAFT_398415 [Aspergillus ellipticus CBS 707.79]
MSGPGPTLPPPSPGDVTSRQLSLLACLPSPAWLAAGMFVLIAEMLATSERGTEPVRR